MSIESLRLDAVMGPPKCSGGQHAFLLGVYTKGGDPLFQNGGQVWQCTVCLKLVIEVQIACATCRTVFSVYTKNGKTKQRFCRALCKPKRRVKR